MSRDICELPEFRGSFQGEKGIEILESLTPIEAFSSRNFFVSFAFEMEDREGIFRCRLV